jgi:hypothetical protein
MASRATMAARSRGKGFVGASVFRIDGLFP